MLEDVRQAAHHRFQLLSFLTFRKHLRVQLPIFIKKMSDMHFSSSSLAWIRSYLTGRSQEIYDRATDAISAPVSIDAGIGSWFFAFSVLADFINIV